LQKRDLARKSTFDLIFSPKDSGIDFSTPLPNARSLGTLLQAFKVPDHQIYNSFQSFQQGEGNPTH